MRNLLVFFSIFLFTGIYQGAYAQNATIQGKWIVESAVVNLLDRGMSQEVHKLTQSELAGKSIPATIQFTNSQMEFSVGENKLQSGFSFENGLLIFNAGSKEYTYTAWLSGDDELVLKSGYTDSDYKGNDLMITYKRIK